MIEFIPAKENDKDFAFEVKKKGLREYVEKMFTWDEAKEISSHNERFEQYDFWVIWYEEKKVGVLSYGINNETLKLRQIYVLPEFQSKGIGAECISQLLVLSKPDNLTISLQVLLANERAKTFYEKMGFNEIGRSDTHFFMETHT